MKFISASFLLFFSLAVFSDAAWALRDPILLLHGATRNGAFIRMGPIIVTEYWAGVLPILRAQNAEVFVPSIPMDTNRRGRALFLRQYIQENLADRKFHIVAHSLSGTDARYLISILQEPNVLSLTTIATPHRGTPMSDFFSHAKKEQSFFYWLPRILNFHLERLGYVDEVSGAAMERFNQEVLDRADVKYFSVVATGEPWWWNTSPLLWLFRYFALHGEEGADPGPNDGVVPVRSQAWGKVIAIVALDHLGQLNFHWWRHPQQGDAVRLYRAILENLRSSGF